ncbi:Protein CBG22099 [Caenorhabditis briggsae]|uniref:Protein CBG22099 n=1 Tax=Caenorhabditis briggsae TaxID=6238 RepID=A8Y1I9_CAEBR|nr:Protein CBG22099 [Caenorhabditis briggsae]CAP38758.1 Protein CBG22099 [Caenorhabditis briggsae]
MSFQEHHNSNNNIDMNMMVDASSRAVAGKGKKKKTAHFNRKNGNFESKISISDPKTTNFGPKITIFTPKNKTRTSGVQGDFHRVRPAHTSLNHYGMCVSNHDGHLINDEECPFYNSTPTPTHPHRLSLSYFRPKTKKHPEENQMELFLLPLPLRLLTKAEYRTKKLESIKKEISLGLKFQNLLAMHKIWTTMPGDMQRGILAAQREGRAYVAPEDNEPAAKRARIEESDYSKVTFLPPPVEELQEIQQDALFSFDFPIFRYQFVLFCMGTSGQRDVQTQMDGIRAGQQGPHCPQLSRHLVERSLIQRTRPI